MKRAAIVTAWVVLAVSMAGLGAEGLVVPKEKTLLWNGKDFAGWKLFLRESAVEAKEVWSTRDGVIRCEGKPFGYMRTEAEYADYRLHVEYRWPEGAGNSGVLVHMVGPDKVWPGSIECQLRSGDAGDFYVIGAAEFAQHKGVKGRRVPKSQKSSEKPLGEWNTCEVICKGDAVHVLINGVVQNQATETSVGGGRICLQCEGKAIEFRNICVEPPGETPPLPKTGKTPLWNGKDFTGWKLFVPDKNVDVSKVWSIKDGVIRCEGSPTGYMRTEADYSNYKLHVEWRWVGGGGNSGVLVHVSEPDVVWPRSVECQLAAGNAGDFWVIGGTDFKEHANKGDSRVPKKQKSSEKPLGEWNTYEITCKDSTIRVVVNGVLQNEATETNVNKGKVLLQSEGGVIEFREIYLEPLK